MTVFAMMFPGQGSQVVGMLADLAKKYALVKITFEEASSVLGYNLWKITQKGPIEELNKTWKTQPALLASSVSIWRIWQQQGGRLPIMLAGHSLGEYSALVCASSLNFTTAIKLVSLRGKIMQEAVPIGRGAMAVIIGLDNNIITSICKKKSQAQVVFPVNFNSLNQVVIAGYKEDVDSAVLSCKEAGAKRAFLLPISVPSHCILMKPAAEKLAQILDYVTLKSPQIPVINNVDVCAEEDPFAIRQALIRQLYSPVRWSEIIQYFIYHGVEVLLEIGPGKVLAKLSKNTIGIKSSISVNDVASLGATIKF